MIFAAQEQIVYLYEPNSKRTFRFDGVVKVQYNQAVQIEDEQGVDMMSYNQEHYVFTKNIKKQAVECTIDIVMSNVYTDTGDLPGSTGDRSRNAYDVLSQLRNDKTILTVVTNLHTFDKMLIKTFAVTQDDSNMCGWTGTIVFHEYMAARPIPEPIPKAEEKGTESLHQSVLQTSKDFYAPKLAPVVSPYIKPLLTKNNEMYVRD